jgi:hypothetical protein
MFRKTDPQRSLLECEFLVPPEKAERLRRSWAEVFRERILPLIDEEVFRDAFNQTTGRGCDRNPLVPVRVLWARR